MAPVDPSSDRLYANCLQGLRPSALQKQVLACIPTTWLDDALTGPSAISIPATCPDIERLCNVIRVRIWKVFNVPGHSASPESGEP